MNRWVLFSFIYMPIYFCLAISFFPMDNFSRWGTLVFLPPLATFPVVFFALYFLNRLSGSYNRKIFISLMVFHYLCTLILVFNQLVSADELKLTIKMFESYRISFLFTIVWYIAGQLVIWFFFVKGLRAKLPKELS